MDVDLFYASTKYTVSSCTAIRFSYIKAYDVCLNHVYVSDKLTDKLTDKLHPPSD